jgi:hypothetical protein
LHFVFSGSSIVHCSHGVPVRARHPNAGRKPRAPQESPSSGCSTCERAAFRATGASECAPRSGLPRGSSPEAERRHRLCVSGLQVYTQEMRTDPGQRVTSGRPTPSLRLGWHERSSSICYRLRCTAELCWVCKLSLERSLRCKLQKGQCCATRQSCHS